MNRYTVVAVVVLVFGMFASGYFIGYTDGYRHSKQQDGWKKMERLPYQPKLEK